MYARKIIIGLIIFLSPAFAFAQFIQQGPQGGTGIGSTAAGNIGNCLKVSTVSPLVWTIGSCGSGGGGAFPFDAFPNYNSTSTPIGFLAGLFSNSSTTLNGTINFPGISNGCLNITSGVVGSTACGAGAAFPFTNFVGYNATTTVIGFNGLFSTASTTIMNNYFLSSGLVGIASSSPWGLLSVNPNAIGTGVPEFVVGSSTATHFIVTGAGMTGINVVSPLYALDISGGANFGQRITGAGNSLLLTGSDPYIKIHGTGTGVPDYQMGVIAGALPEVFVGSITNHPFTFYTNNTKKATLDINGNFLVATTTGNYLLTSYSASAPQVALSSGGSYPLWTMRNSFGNFYLATSSVDGLATSTQSALTITNTGQFILGTTTAGCLNVTSTGLISSLTCATGGGTFPFTVNTGYNSTTSVIGFTGGLFSTASSTFNNSVYFSNLTAGNAYIGSNSQLATAATSSVTCTAPLNCTSFDVLKNGGAITLTAPLTVAQGGTNKTAYPANSIITSDSAGTTLIATGTQLTVGNLLATTTATSTFMGNVTIGSITPMGMANGLFSITGNTNNYIQSHLQNLSTGANASGCYVLGDDRATDLTYYGEFCINGSKYAQSTFSSQNSGDVSLLANDGALVIGTASSTNPLADFRFITGGTASSSIRMVIDNKGYLMTGTTTNTRITQEVIASSTAPQLSLSSGAGNAQWIFANEGGNFYLGTTSVSGLATSSQNALSITSNGKFSLGTTTTGCLNASAAGLISILACSGGGTVTQVTQGVGLVNNGSSFTTSGTITGAFASTTIPTIGRLTGFASTGAGGTSIGLYDVATSSLTATGPIAVSNTPFIIGTSGAVITCTTCMTAYNPFTPIFPWAHGTTSSLAFGTTTISGSLSATLTLASSTAPQLSLSQGGGLNWIQRNVGGNLYIASTTADGLSTTTTSALTLLGSGVPSATIGTSSCMTTLKNGSLCMGGGTSSTGATGTSTITMAKIQFSGMNSAGAPVCMFVNSSNAFTVIAGLCANP